MTNPNLQANFARIETSTINELTRAGFDAFRFESAASLVGGVAVRVPAHSPRLEWLGTKEELAPANFSYTQEGKTFTLHAGLIQHESDIPRVLAFAEDLLALVDAQIAA